MRLYEYHKPDGLQEALDLLRRDSPRTTILAGGTWLNAEGSHQIEAVVDIGNLGLDKVMRISSPPLLRLGATTTLQAAVEELREVPGLDIIAKAAHAMSALNLRNRTTVAGSIVTSDANSPLVVALLACDADLILQADEERTVKLSAFLDYRERILAEKVIIKAVQMPIPSLDTVGSYQRIGRTSRDYPIVCAVARCAVKDGIVGNLRVAVGGVAPTPIRLSALEFALEKKPVKLNLERALDEAVSTLTPQGDWLGSSEYRKEMARVLVQRAIFEAAHIQ